MTQEEKADLKKKEQAAKQAQEATALGKIIQLVSDKLKEHLCDEIDYYSFRSEPLMMDKRGSTIPKSMWKTNGTIKAEFINNNSDNIDHKPLHKFFTMIDNEVNNSRDMVTI